MAKLIPVSNEYAAVRRVADTIASSKTLTKDWRDRMARVYEAVTGFEYPKANPWDTGFKVNKCFEIENRWVSRIFAKNPSPIVSLRTDVFDEGDLNATPEERDKKLSMKRQFAAVAQDYLKQVFAKPGQKEKIRKWARSMVRYGISHAEVRYHYVKANVYAKDGTVAESVVDEYPTVEPLSWTDCFFDPRYETPREMPAFVIRKNGVRMSDLERCEDYFNLDKVRLAANTSAFNANPDTWRAAMYAEAGIPTNFSSPLDEQSLTVDEYQGLYEIDGKEALVKLTTVGGMILIGAQKITDKSIEKLAAFDDPETYLATGVVEPIMGLVDEYNFKKNAAAAYINAALNRTWLWSPNSGVSPDDLRTDGRRSGGIIPIGGSLQQAEANLKELDRREINPSYFQEQNNFERDIQNSSFTIDTAQQPGAQALTDTATGARIKFFESSAVIAMVRDNFEDAMRSLCYKILLSAFDNLKGNVIIKGSGDGDFWEVNKEAFRNAIKNFDIQIEIGSSSIDGMEERRSNAIAAWNISNAAAKAGVPADLGEAYRVVMGTFEGIDPNRLLSPVPQLAQGGGGALAQPGPVPTVAAADTAAAVGKSAMFA